jgi:hypothetical protein
MQAAITVSFTPWTIIPAASQQSDFSGVKSVQVKILNFNFGLPFKRFI